MDYIGSSKAQKHSMVTELKRGMTNVVKPIITNEDHQILRNKQLTQEDMRFKKVLKPLLSETTNNHNLKIFSCFFLQAISVL